MPDTLVIGILTSAPLTRVSLTGINTLYIVLVMHFSSDK